MFTSTYATSMKAMLVAAVMLGASTSAQAEVMPTDIVNAIETNLAVQMDEMLAVAKREFILSVKAQMADVVFELTGDEQATADTSTTTSDLVTQVNP